MATIDVDPQFANELHKLAAIRGMDLESYLKMLVRNSGESATPHMTMPQLEALLKEHEFSADPLPADFSRADIYRRGD